MGEVYKERKEKGNDSLPILSVSIHTGVSDDELKSNTLGKEVKRSEDKSLYKHTYPGDLVFNMMRAWQGAIGVVKNEGMVSPAYIVANPSDKLYPRFMNFYFQGKSVISQINNLSYGVTDFRKRLYWDSFAIANAAFPSISEQKKISDFLDILSDTIALHQLKLDLLKETKKGFLQKMFSKNGAKVPEIRFPGFTEDWEQRKLGDIFKKDTQKNKDLEFHSDSVISVAKMKLSPPSAKSSDEYMKTYNKIWKGNIAFEGHTNDEFPNGRFVLNDCQDGIVSHIYDVYSAVDEYDNEFMKRYINNPYVMRKILINATSSARMMKSLNSLEFLQQSILLPILSEQQKIGGFFYQLDNTITLHQKKLSALKKLKTALLQKMFI